MGNNIWAGIPSHYLTSQLGQLSLASPDIAKSSTSFNWLGWKCKCHICRVAYNKV